MKHLLVLILVSICSQSISAAADRSPNGIPTDTDTAADRSPDGTSEATIDTLASDPETPAIDAAAATPTAMSPSAQALHAAIQNASIEDVRRALAMPNLNLNAINENGQTPLEHTTKAIIEVKPQALDGLLTKEERARSQILYEIKDLIEAALIAPIAPETVIPAPQQRGYLGYLQGAAYAGATSAASAASNTAAAARIAVIGAANAAATAQNAASYAASRAASAASYTAATARDAAYAGASGVASAATAARNAASYTASGIARGITAIGDAAMQAAAAAGEAALAAAKAARERLPTLLQSFAEQAHVTPLHIAVAVGDPMIIEMALIIILNPLAEATHPDIARSRADDADRIRTAVNAAGAGGITPLQIAVFCGNVRAAELLRRHGAQFDVVTHDSQATVIVQKVLELAAEIEAVQRLVGLAGGSLGMKDAEIPQFSAGASLLHLAAIAGHPQMVNYLLAVAADQEAQAAKAPRSTSQIQAEQEAHLLAAAGAPVNPQADARGVNVRDALGNTPLHMAATRGSLEVVQILHTAKANHALKNAQGKTALDLAQASRTRLSRLNGKMSIQPAVAARITQLDEVISELKSYDSLIGMGLEVLSGWFK